LQNTRADNEKLNKSIKEQEEYFKALLNKSNKEKADAEKEKFEAEYLLNEKMRLLNKMADEH